MNSEQQYITLFEQCETMINKHSSELINKQRKAAFQRFEALGFPNKKQEKYRYTDISEMFRDDYGMNLQQIHADIDPHSIFSCNVPNMHTSLFFTINDSFCKATKEDHKIPISVFVGSLKDFSIAYPAVMERYYNQTAIQTQDGVTAFNTTFVQDGFCLYVPKNVKVESSIQLIQILYSKNPLLCNRRVLIILEEGAEAQMLMCDHTMSSTEFLTTQVVEVFVNENASFRLFEIEENHTETKRLSNVYVQQEANSRVEMAAITLENGITRNSNEVYLNGKGAVVNLYGMGIGDNQQKIDNHTYITHNAAYCNSDTLYKYVLDDKAEGAFSGRVIVREGAIKTNSKQTNKNLCLTSEARMYTQPQLEIYADDVKCSHGSTVGQLDEDALFYMRQRGISEREGRMLLMFAFINDVIKHISIEALRDQLHILVEKRFRGELKQCSKCFQCKK